MTFERIGFYATVLLLATLAAGAHAQTEEPAAQPSEEQALPEGVEERGGWKVGGCGGQLVRTLALAEGGRASSDDLTTAIRAALDDMRLVINSLDPLVDDLTTLLGTLRGRLDPSLRRQGLRFEWRAADLPATPDLGPEEFLHILRILQEAITNVLKHAKAHTIRVTTGERASESGAPGLFIVVRDDGIGLDPAATPGRGRANMDYRAERLGGELSVRRAPESGDGTLVDLWIPLARNPAGPLSGGQPSR